MSLPKLGQSAIGWVDQQRHDIHGWQKLMQQFEPLWPKFNYQTGSARHIASRPVQIRDQA